MGKKIFLVRHGQTDFNLNGIVQGSGVDSSLNETGRRQAEAFHRYYSGRGIQKVFTSALVRTHQSVDGFIRDGVSWEIIPELNEISWGKHEGRVIQPEEDAYYHWMIRQWQMGQTSLATEGGESPDEVAARLRTALTKIMSDEAETILICMHGRAMRVMLCVMMDYPLSRMDEFEHRNLCLYEIDFSGDSGFSIALRNSTMHLEAIRAINS